MGHGKGFTLAEMAVAVFILALILFGALVPFSTQMDIRNAAETRRTMDSIRDAIIGYTQANGRLPCPANGAIATGTAGAGVSPASCPTASSGVVPWATLGVPETDSWNRRFSYSVDSIFADAVAAATWGAGCTPTPTPTQSSFALCSVGALTVNTRDETTRATSPLASGVTAVFISHGKNGWGAYQSNGVQLPAPPGADEIANANHANGANNFVSRNPTPATSGCNDADAAQPLCEFDDIVTPISSSTLIAREVAAGKLP
jgi:prepilin-type N-terminal cleavage/methylation domain-containing protein